MDSLNDPLGKKKIFAPCLYPQACPGYQNNSCATHLGFRNTSRLCQACSPGYSRTTKSKCVPCDNEFNYGKSILIAFAVLILFVLFVLLNTMRMRSFRSFDAERRRKSLHSTIKRIVLSHIQMLGIVLGLTVPWPNLLETVLTTLSSVASFSEGVNSFECLYKGIDHASFYNGVLVFTAVGPLVFALGIALYWFVLVRKFKALKCGTLVHAGSFCPKNTQRDTPVQIPSSRGSQMSYSDADAFISSVVLFWFIALPSLLLIGSNALKCWAVGDTTFIFVDLQKECYVDDHLWYSLLVAFPMCVFYGLIIPGFFMLRLRRVGSARLTDPSLMLRWGMLHSGYREETYWWELVVLIRKYFIILLVTFNNRGKFQLHISLAVLILALHVHDSQHPFGHRRDNPVNSILHRYEMSSLLILLFMLWCADFFSLDLCKDDKFSCNTMVVVILLSNFILVCYLIFMFVRAFCVRNGLEKKLTSFIRKRSLSFRHTSDAEAVLGGGGGGEQKVGQKSGTHHTKKTKKGRTATRERRLSSREVMALEMTSMASQNEREEDVIDLSLVNPMLKKNNNGNGNTVKEIRRNKVRRLSKVMKARETTVAVKNRQEEKEEEGQEGETEDNELGIEILKDEVGRRYSYNNKTGESLWVDPEVEEMKEGGEEHGGETEENDKEIHVEVDVGGDLEEEEELVFDIDEATGRRYSYNQATGTSLWVD